VLVRCGIAFNEESGGLISTTRRKAATRAVELELGRMNCPERPRVQPIRSQLERPGRPEGIEKAAVVRNEDDCAPETLKRRFELFDCLEVEVVCRLV
jgi:hypothetical protein